MKPVFDNGPVQLYQGDARDLSFLPDGSVQCVVTSPPYWGLRDYGLAPSVWDGEPGCDHEWGHDLPHGRRGNRGISGTGGNLHPTLDAAGQGAGAGTGGAFCQLCNAWHGNLGLEPTPELYVQHLVEVMREAKRVLRDDGTLWLNLGDSYASGEIGRHDRSNGYEGEYQRASRQGERRQQRLQTGLKPKDLVGIPWRVAFALQADGWWLRSDIVWSKPNPMPESVTDRPTRSHEYLFLLTKSGKPLFWTHRDDPSTRSRPKADWRWINQITGEERTEAPEGVGRRGMVPCLSCGGNGVTDDLEECSECKGKGQVKLWRRTNLWRGHAYFYDADAVREQGTSGPSDLRKMQESRERIGGLVKDATDPLMKASALTNIGQKRSVGSPQRNRRSVWTIATQPFPGAHFAVFPRALVEPCVLAGTSERGCCPECGAPWARVIEKALVPTKKAAKTFVIDERDFAADSNDQGSNRQKDGHKPGYINSVTTTGWRPTCTCNAGEPTPCTVLDPFIGSGTVALVAQGLGRRAIGVDAKAEYLEMARKRLESIPLPL